MSKFHVLVHSLLLATSPSLLAYPQCEQSILQQVYNQEKPFEDFNLTYDDIVKLLQDIEEERIEEISEEKIERITHFIAFLAQKGMLPGDYAANAALENDIAALFEGKDAFLNYAYVCNSLNEYTMPPALLNGRENGILCSMNMQHHIFMQGSHFRYQRDTRKDKHHHHHKDKHHRHDNNHTHHEHKKNAFAKIKDFIVKHKKAIIIGAVIVVVATVIIVAVATASSAGALATSAAGAAAGAASAPDSNRKSHAKNEKGNFPLTEVPTDIPSGIAVGVADLKPIIDNQIISFKENIKQNQFFQPTNPSIGQQGLSWEESGRTLGSLFAHESYNNIHRTSYYPGSSSYDFFVPVESQDTVMGHSEIDRKFSTDYAYLYSQRSQKMDFNTLSHQVRGEKSLESGYYDEAIHDFEKAIEANPTNPIPYLEKGIAHFNLGQYDHSLEDYQQFTSQTQAQKSNALSVSEFSLGFAKGVPKGVYESGEGLLLFMADFVTHPIQTSGQIVDSVTTLVNLVRNDEWGVVAEALSPEAHQLVTQWDTLPSEQKGELAGYVVGKHGADILVPGALAKVASKSIKSVQELAAVCKNFQIAQETLLLETAADIGNSAKIAEVIEMGQKTAHLADELGFTAREMGELKQAGQLESTVANTLEQLSMTMQESFALHAKAKEVLKPYLKKPLPEFKVRELIHETGIPTFHRPKGIPENFISRITGKGAGMEYIHPTNKHFSVRVMPGKPHSSYPHQQKPYVVQMKDGKAFDKHGNLILHESPEAHIPLEEFIYRE